MTNREEALLVSNSTLSLTGGTGGDSLLRIGPRALTVPAGFLAGNFDLCLDAKYSLFETQLKVKAKISTAAGLVWLSSRASKDFSEAKEITQDVAEIREGVGIESFKTSTSGADAGMPKAIVSSSLITVTQDAIGLGSLFEFLLRFLVPGILIGMVLYGQFAISALDFLPTGISIDAQYFVIVSVRQTTLLSG